jgi:beta-xylosidase
MINLFVVVFIRKHLFLCFLILFSGNILSAQDKAFLFSYFMNNGEDGLHLAYSYDGMKWTALQNNKSYLTPTVGEDKLMRDPCIIKGADGEFHMVWTISWKEKGIGYAHSKDLIHWSEQMLIPVMVHEEQARNCWAPEIFYDEKTGLYMIIWSTTIPGRFQETDESGDNGLNHRMYYVTTRDFKSFSKTELFYDHGFNVIDGSLIMAGDTYYLFLKDETRHPPEKNIRIATSSKLTSGYGQPSMPITGEYWAEGPSPIKIDDIWMVYFDKYRKHRMGAVKSKDLINWTDVSDQVIFPKGTRHGTVFQVDTEILKGLLNE